MQLVNRLGSQTSPYLLQHAANPVAWQPWDQEALALAAQLDRPLLISIGYSACHWCHVMAHESFEDEDIASLLNRAYVPIKIDREERPDLDQLYMSATQAATGHGGWPMTVMATPDGRPFFAGTYFPPVDRGGQPGFPRVLLALEEAWATRRDEVLEQADALSAAVLSEASFADTLALEMPTGDLAFDQILDELVGALGGRFDAALGGFGGAPKFPRPSYVEACLIHHARSGDPFSLEMAATTLRAMAAGGIYDHLAGGFARYSVDDQWLVPHFEKMLTDQALLARTYLHAYQLTGEPDHAQVVRETLDWVLDGLGLPDGGLASSVDADAAGVEGSHAVFTCDQVAAALAGLERCLSPEEACEFYGVTEEGTFEHGASVLARRRDLPLGRSELEEATRLALLAARAIRPQPGVDDKIIVEWNAMTAAVLAEAAGALDRPRWADAARSIVELLDSRFRDEGGRLRRAGRAGIVAQLGMLGDHAWLLEAMTRLYELDGEAHWLERAEVVARSTIELFFDGEVPTASQPECGRGFFTTGRDAEILLARSKDVFDSALPSATATIATALARLAALRGDLDLLAVAERTVSLLGAALERHPLAAPDLVLALGQLRAGRELAVPGPSGSLLDAARRAYSPFTVFVHGEPGSSPLLEDRAIGMAYLCRHHVCERPTSVPAELLAQLAASVPS